MNCTTITIQITKDDLPAGPHWDEDGACFTAILSDPDTTGVEWRWAANNAKAFAKGAPDKPLFTFCPMVFAPRKEFGIDATSSMLAKPEIHRRPSSSIGPGAQVQGARHD